MWERGQILGISFFLGSQYPQSCPCLGQEVSTISQFSIALQGTNSFLIYSPQEPGEEDAAIPISEEGFAQSHITK